MNTIYHILSFSVNAFIIIGYNRLMARPTKMTNITLGKLKEAFLMGCSDREACLYADINPDTLYEYQKLNTAYTEQKESFKSNPVLLARKTVVGAIEKDPDLALKYLERKKKDEFSLRQNLDVTSNGERVGIPVQSIMKINNDVLSDGVDRASGM